MTWVANQGQNQYGGQGFTAGLLKYLQGPEIQGLSQGLLSQASPSMTEPRSIAGGLAHGLEIAAKRKDQERQREFEKAKLDILKGHLDVDTAKFDFEQKKQLDEMKRRAEFESSLQPQEETITAPTEQPSMPNREALEAAGNAIQAAPGLLNQAPATPEISSAAPPQIVPTPVAAPQNKKIKLSNGWEVSQNQYRQIQAALQANKPEKIVEILGSESEEKEPELIKIARSAGLVPGTPEWNEFLKNVKLKPSTQVNIGDEATRSFVTKQQNVISGVDSVLPAINDLINLAKEDKIPYQGTGTSRLSPNQQAKYEALASQAIEPLLGSFALSSNEHNAKMVAKQIERQPLETKDAYIARLKELKADLINRRKYASGITSFKGMEQFPSYEDTKKSEPKYSQADLEYTAKKHGKTVEQVKAELEGK